VAGLNVPQYVQAATVRHMDVQQYQIPVMLPQLVQGLVATRGFTDGVDAGIGFQELFEPRSDHGVIVGDEYS
jgi:hypothetical protein